MKKPRGGKTINTVTIALVLLAVIAIAFIALRYSSLEERSLFELDNQITQGKIDALDVEADIIQVYLKESDNGLDEPGYYVAIHDDFVLSSDLPSSAEHEAGKKY